MRHLLISVAALALTAGATVAQPNDPSQIRGKGGFGQYQQQQADRGGNGGPTAFTNQVTGQQPGPNGERPDRGDRGNWQGRQQNAPQQQAVAPQQQPDQNRGNWQGRGDRGNWQGRDDNRRDFGRDDNRRDWNNGGGWNRDRDRGYRSGYYSDRRDWRGYGNYHRDWRPTRRFRAPAYYRPRGWYSHRWTFGEYLPSLFWARDYWLDYRLYDLPPPPYGAVWVRVGDDALMIDDRSGEIITVAYNVFY
jgi:Ni/Co efflux regulator RcnB